MRARRKRSGHFLCFGAVDLPEEEASMKTGESSAGSFGRTDVLAPEVRRQRRRRIDCRFLTKIFRSVLFVSSLNRNGRSVSRMASADKPAVELSGKSSDSNDRREDTILSASSSSLSSSTSSSVSSSCLSSASSSSFREPEPKQKPELRQKRASPRSETKNPPPSSPPARNYDSATGLFLLLLSLSAMVFCGRIYAILWTSSWLCLIPRRNSDAGLAVENATVVVPPKLRREGLEEYEKKRVVLEGLLERNRRV